MRRRISGKRKYIKNSVMFYSQAGQDVWVLQRIGNKGFFVDVGAHDGVESSNTYALEKAGWKGVCVEPSEAYEKMIGVRNCSLVKVAAVADKKSQTGLPLTEILYGLSAPTTIDYLSIDVDGGEMDVLRGMDFDKYHVKLITIEHNKYAEGTARKQEIYEYLTNEGFRRTHEDVRCLDGEWFGLEYEDWYENLSLVPTGRTPEL